MLFSVLKRKWGFNWLFRTGARLSTDFTQDFLRIMTGNQFTEQWNGVKDCVRTHLQAVNPCAQVAFGLYPHDDGQALQLLADLSLHSPEPDALALPPLYTPEELSP